MTSMLPSRTAELVREQFPRLKIFARARNRQHAFALKDVGVRYIIRETYVSSLEMAASVLESLGDSSASAKAAVRKFRQHDEATFDAQYAVKDDETKFLATSREAARSWNSCSRRTRRRRSELDGRRSTGTRVLVRQVVDRIAARPG